MTRCWRTQESCRAHCQCALQLSCVSPEHTLLQQSTGCALQLSCVSSVSHCQCALQLSCVSPGECHTCQCALDTQESCRAHWSTCQCALQLSCVSPAAVSYTGIVEHIGKYDTLLEIHRRVVEHIGKYDTLLEIHRRVVEHIGKYDTCSSSPVYLHTQESCELIGKYDTAVSTQESCRAHCQV